MKQPELGQKIAALRKAKGFTQEELCQSCGINVRSLQRIESGEVNPRVYTLKLISENLNYDFWSQVTRLDDTASFWQRNFINSPDDDTMKQHAKWGWIGGVVYLLMTVPDVMLGALRYTETLGLFMKSLYILNACLVIFSAFLFYRGFATLGRRLGQSILTISANLVILLTAILYGIDILLLNFPVMAAESMVFLHLILFGFTSIFFGIGLSRIEPKVGSSAKFAAILEIFSGICFVLIITFIVGLVTIIPAMILEIILLHKVYQKYHGKDGAFILAS